MNSNIVALLREAEHIVCDFGFHESEPSSIHKGISAQPPHEMTIGLLNRVNGWLDKNQSIPYANEAHEKYYRRLKYISHKLNEWEKAREALGTQSTAYFCGCSKDRD